MRGPHSAETKAKLRAFQLARFADPINRRRHAEATKSAVWFKRERAKVPLYFRDPLFRARFDAVWRAFVANSAPGAVKRSRPERGQSAA